VFYRIADGKITEFRGQFDLYSMMQQLAPVPALATR
jgi:predicted ester cyclase